MKKQLIILVLMALAICPPVLAQTEDSTTYSQRYRRQIAVRTIDRDSLRIDSMQRLNVVGDELVQLRDGGKDGNMVLEVAGFGLTLSRTPMRELQMNPPRVWTSFLSDMEFGFTQLTGVDYSGYTPGQKGFLDQRLGASFHFSIPFMQVCFALNKSRTLSLAIGFQYTVDNYRLISNALTVGNLDGRLVPVSLDPAADKSKIVTSSLGIPVRLNYEPVRNLRLSAVAYSDFTLGADAIVKRPKEKSGVSGFRTYQLGVGASVSYYGFGVYARYGITPVFKSGVGPDCHAVSFGFSYSFRLSMD